MPLDVTDLAAVEHALGVLEPRVIVDLSNVFADQREGSDGVTAFEDLLTLTARRGVERVIYASSAAVYGDIGTAPFIESDDLRGASPYAQWKIRCESSLRSFHAAEGVQIGILRIFNVFGPACTNSLINRLRDGPTPPLAMTDAFIRDYVHVDDVADAIVRACEVGVERLCVNIATGTPTNNLQLARAVDRSAYVSAPPVVSYSVGNPDAAAAHLGWQSSRGVLGYLARSPSKTS